MIELSRPARILGIAVAAVLALGACGDSSDSGAPAAATVTPAAGDGEVPQTAGPLTGRQMPDPQVLGDGWTERADPGAGHDEETDPGAPSTQQRDVAELMDGLVPIGCPEAAVDIALPRPEYALERTYAGPSGQPGVALILQFGDASRPEAFLAGFARQMRACPPRPTGADDPISLGFRSVERTAEVVYGLRQERGADADPHRYLVIVARDRDTNRVGVLYLSGEPASRALTLGTNLIRAIRSD